MSIPNLNRPALYTECKLDAADFQTESLHSIYAEMRSHDAAASDCDDSADGLPMPTRTGTIAAGILVVVGGVLFVVGAWHLVAMVLS